MRQAQQTKDRSNLSYGPECATAEDRQKHFAAEMAELFHLAFLLTANVEDAERCVILAMRQCMEADAILKHWLPVWVRRSVITTGIEIVTGHQREPLPSPVLCNSNGSAQGPAQSTSSPEGSAGVFTLAHRERLVYVLSVIEQYSIRECAHLLGRSNKDVREARASAVDNIAAFEIGLQRQARSIGEEMPWTISSPAGGDADSFPAATVD